MERALLLTPIFRGILYNELNYTGLLGLPALVHKFIKSFRLFFMFRIRRVYFSMSPTYCHKRLVSRMFCEELRIISLFYYVCHIHNISLMNCYEHVCNERVCVSCMAVICSKTREKIKKPNNCLNSYPA